MHGNKKILNIRFTMLTKLITKKKVHYCVAGQHNHAPYLYGENQAWNRKTILQTSNGESHFEMELPCGVYQYKFYSDGTWFTDPDNNHTLQFHGNRNSLTIVDGISEPVLHAPGLPFLWYTKSGILTIRAMLRCGVKDANLFLRWTESDPSCVKRRKMDVVLVDGETVWYSISIAPGGIRIHYFFELEVNGQKRCIGQSENNQIPFSTDFRIGNQIIPQWWENAIIYEIVVDRFKKSSDTTSIPSPDKRHGGTLDDITESIPYFEELGITAIYITPVHASDSVHRYDATDFSSIDDAVGGMDALKRLVEGLHKKNICLILDISFNHVNIKNPMFQDVMEKGEKSRFAHWFYINSFQAISGEKLTYKCYNNNTNLPLLNTEPQDVQDYCISIFRMYLELGIDGFRIDAAEECSDSLLSGIAECACSNKKRPAIFGEIISPRSFRYLEWLDSRTDFSVHNHIRVRYLSGLKIDCREIINILSEQDFFRGGPASTIVNFMSNHDTDRLASVVRDYDDLRLLNVLLLMLPGQPVIYYGEETGLKPDTKPTGIFESSQHGRMPMLWNRAEWNLDIFNTVKEIINIRKKNACFFTNGLLRTKECTESFLSYALVTNTESLEMYINFGDTEIVRDLISDKYHCTTSLFISGTALMKSNSVAIGRKSAVILCRKVNTIIINSVSAGIDNSIRDAYLKNTPSLPFPKIAYVSLTEKCNLRCRHCITDAGGKTVKNIYAEAQPWLIDTLNPYLQCFEYLGFSHAGENMLSTLLIPLVKNFVKERNGKKCTIHLLTNGMHDTNKIVEAVESGVNSLSVSLDGITEQSNDFLRKGGRYKSVLKVLEQLYIRSQKTKLRFGVSITLTAWNIDEIPEMFDLLIGTGVHWIKLEELYPVNQLGKAIMVDIQSERITMLIELLEKKCDEFGIVFVNHLNSDAWALPCCLNEKSSNAWKKDSFINSVDLHPCKNPWEIVCIEPDGDVKPLSFYNSTAGNLYEKTLAEIVASDIFMNCQYRSFSACRSAGLPENCIV